MEIKEFIEYFPKKDFDVDKSNPIEVSAIKEDYNLKVRLSGIDFNLAINPIPFDAWRKLAPSKEVRIGAYSGADEKLIIQKYVVTCKEPSLEYILKEVGLLPEVMNLERKKLSKIVNKAVIKGLENEGVDISKVDGKKIINGYLYFDSKELLAPKKAVSPQVLEKIFLKEKDKYTSFWAGYSNNLTLVKMDGMDFLEYQILELNIVKNNKRIIKHSAIAGELTKIQNLLGDFSKGWEVKKP